MEISFSPQLILLYLESDAVVPFAFLRGWQERGASSTSLATTTAATTTTHVSAVEEELTAMASSWTRVSEEGGGV